MYRTAPRITLALGLFVSFAAHATEPQTKTVTQGYAGACQGASLADESRIARGALRGTATATARVICSPGIDSSENGTLAFGVSFGNSSAVNAVVTCTAEVSTAAPGAPKLHARSVMVSPKGHAGVEWTAPATGEGRTFRGGQSGVTCTLPAGVSVSNVWTRSVAN